MTTTAPRQTRLIVSEGTHLARCFSFVHIGTVQDTYMGEPREIDKIRLGFEFPEEKAVFRESDDAKPFVHSQEYTLAMGGKANLRKLVEGMNGKKLSEDDAYNYDLESLVDKCCLLNIVHKTAKQSGNIRAEIVSASSLMKGQKCPELFNQELVLSYDNWNQEKFEKLPEFLREKIKTSFEYRVMIGELTAPNIKVKLSDEEKAKLKEARDKETQKLPKEEINTDDIPF